MSTFLRAYIADAAFRPLPEYALQLYVEPWVAASRQAAFYRQIAQMDQRYTDEIEPRYGQVCCPGATLHNVPRAGHLVQEDAPEAVVAAVLSELTLRRSGSEVRSA